jgi:hypothetical protein
MKLIWILPRELLEDMFYRMSLFLNFDGEMFFFSSSYSSLSARKPNHEISTRMKDSESKC